MIHAFYNVGYLNDADACIWASAAYWRAEEAIFLAMNLSPQKDGEENDESNALDLGREYVIRAEMAARARIFGELKYIQKPPFADPSDGSDDIMEILYTPEVFVKWAIQRFPNFPKKLYQAVKGKHPEEFLGTPEPIDTAPGKKEPSLRNNQKAKERCQAIAEMLWDQDGSIKVKDMVERMEIQEYGQGSYYEKSTVYDWVTEVSPKNRKQVLDDDSA